MKRNLVDIYVKYRRSAQVLPEGGDIDGSYLKTADVKREYLQHLRESYNRHVPGVQDPEAFQEIPASTLNILLEHVDAIRFSLDFIRVQTEAARIMRRYPRHAGPGLVQPDQGDQENPEK